jgi:hypothetical protein
MSEGSSDTPVYLSARRSTNQTILPGKTWGNVIVVMDSSQGQGIQYDTSTGHFVLEAERTYRITAQLGWLTSENAPGPTYFCFQVVNADNGQEIGPQAEAIGSGYTPTAVISPGFCDMIYTPSETGTYCLKILGNGGIPTTIYSEYSIRADVSTFLNIEEITSKGGGQREPLRCISSTRSNPQIIETGCWANRNVIMNSFLEPSNIEYTKEGEFRLDAGVTYRITAQLGWEAKTPEFYAFCLFNTGTKKQVGPAAEALPSDTPSFNVSGGVLDVIHTPDVDGFYCLKIMPDVKAGPSSMIRADVGTCMNIVALTEGRVREFVTASLYRDTSIPEGQNWTNRAIIMDKILDQQGAIKYDDRSGQFYLTAGKTYRITAQLSWVLSSVWYANIDKFYAFGVFNPKTSEQIGPFTEILYRGFDSNNASGGVLDVIFAPHKSDWYHLKMAPSVRASADAQIHAMSSYLNIVTL